MRYRGKRYTVFQGLSPDIWKWVVELNEKIVKSGESKTLAAAETSARWIIDKALSLKKVKQGASPEDHRPQ